MEKGFYWIKYMDNLVVAERVIDKDDGVDFWTLTGSAYTIYDHEVEVIKKVALDQTEPKNDILSFLTLGTDDYPEVHEWMACFSKVIYKDQEDLGEDLYSSDLHEPHALLNEDTEIPPFMEKFRSLLQEMDVAYVRFVDH